MKEPPQPNPRVPQFGEHSEALAQEAGLTAEAATALKSKGVI